MAQKPGKKNPARKQAAPKKIPAARAARALAALRREYPDAGCALTHETPFQLLVSTILSAQCSDARVNSVTPALFAKYPDPAALAAARPAELEAIVRPTGFYRNKAKNLIGMAGGLVERFGGAVPRTLAELITLPGAARKTANVVLGTAFGIAEGVVVDTHVGRLVRRLGLTRHEDPVKVEATLMKLVPRGEWIFFSHALIRHGRRVCAARKPACGRCSMAGFCPSAEIE